jgi:hypothetical protein
MKGIGWREFRTGHARACSSDDGDVAIEAECSSFGVCFHFDALAFSGSGWVEVSVSRRILRSVRLMFMPEDFAFSDFLAFLYM